MDDRERDLADAADDLAGILEELRTELGAPPRGPLGLPRPPRPGELLRFTEQYTIPALVSLLETNIRLLELLAGAIRLAEGRPPEEAVDERTDRLASAGRTTLRKLDDALADLQSAAAGGEPANPEVRRLLEEARELRADIDERLDEATRDRRTDTTPIDVREGESPGTRQEAHEDAGGRGSGGARRNRADDETAADDVGIDVDRELESIKRDLDEGEDGSGGEEGEGNKRDGGSEEGQGEGDGDSRGE